MKKIICIVQARLGSTRLPNKILKKINNKTVIELVLDRIKTSKKIEEVIVATTTNKKDDKLIDFLKDRNINYYRGSEDDVLERYYDTAKLNSADIVVRVTSDCPFIDSEIIDEMLLEYEKINVDYLSNTIDRTYPTGLDVEIFSFKTLEKAHKESLEKEDREHVTPYIWRQNDKFKIRQYKDLKNNSDIRITLDTNEDFELINKIYKLSNYQMDIKIKGIMEILNKNPDLLNINLNVKAKLLENSKYLKELNIDDCDLLYKWANDEERRKNSFNSNYIKYDEHKLWFEKQFDKTIKTYILCDYHKKIGVISVKQMKNKNTISYSIDKKFRNLGYGKIIMQLMERQFIGKTLTAYVKKDNVKSIKIFKALGYRLIEEKEKVIFEKYIK